jgi:hypothetical protein
LIAPVRSLARRAALAFGALAFGLIFLLVGLVYQVWAKTLIADLDADLKRAGQRLKPFLLAAGPASVRQVRHIAEIEKGV